MKAEGATSGLARQDDKQRQRCTRFLKEHKAIDGPSEDLEDSQHRRCCRVHVVEVGFYTEVAYAQKYK